MRTRRSWRNQERLWRELGGVPLSVRSRGGWKNIRRPRPIAVAPPVLEPWAPRCGCPTNAPEADCKVWKCPCGEHCPEGCGRL